MEIRADLISREAVHEMVNGLQEWCITLPGNPRITQVGYMSDAVRFGLDRLPAVAAAPVVHGQWLGRRYDFKEYKYIIVPYDATTFDNPDDLFCSVCNEPALSNGAENDVPSNYCPNCGAKMDADKHLAYADQSGAEYADNPTV